MQNEGDNPLIAVHNDLFVSYESFVAFGQCCLVLGVVVKQKNHVSVVLRNIERPH